MPNRYLTIVNLERVRGSHDYRLIFGDSYITNPNATNDENASISSQALFFPNKVFGLSLWEGNEYGTTKWDFYICKTISPEDKASMVPSVSPGAEILLHVRGKDKCQKVIAWLRGLEEQGYILTELTSHFYKVVDHRFLAGVPAPPLKKKSPLERLIS